MRGAGGFDKEEYLVLVLAESFFKSDVKNDLHIKLFASGVTNRQMSGVHSRK